jgi:cell division protease FtsH
MVAVLPRDGASPFGESMAPRTLELLDDEVRRSIDAAYAEVLALLREERNRLDGLATALLEQETLDQDDAYRAAGLTVPGGEASSARRVQSGAAPIAHGAPHVLNELDGRPEHHDPGG